MKTNRIPLVKRLTEILSHKCIKCLLCILLSLVLLPVYPVYAFSSIEIEQNLLIMKEGDTYQLSPSGLEPIYVTIGDINMGSNLLKTDVKIKSWKSSNTKVATINNKGKVTAKKSGTCVITATYGKMKATAKIRVYTENQLYDHMVAADASFDKLYTALATDKYKNKYDIFYNTETKKNIAKNYEKAARKIESILKSTITTDMNDYEKLMAISAWLIENIEIDNDYISQFTVKNLNRSQKDYTYMDALLYGKCGSDGMGLLLDVLLNLCGVQSEYMLGSGEFKKINGDITSLNRQNIVKLEGNYYYYDFTFLCNEWYDLSQSKNKIKSFYDLLIPSIYGTFDIFSNVAAFAERKFYKQYKGMSPRLTEYNRIRLNYRYRVTFPTKSINKSKYAGYFYDYYTNSILFIHTKDKAKIDKLCPDPYFSSFALYPDSSSDKYKVVLGTEMAINGLLTELLDTATQIKAGTLSYDEVLRWEEVTSMTTEYKEKIGDVLDYEFQKNNSLNQAVDEINSIFSSKRAVMKNKAMIHHLENQMSKLKTLVAEIPVP